jgi:hypothetical protein
MGAGQGEWSQKFQSKICLAAANCPGQRSAQVVELGLEARRPDRFVSPSEPLASRLREARMMLGVATPHDICLACGLKPILGVLTDRLQ